MLEWYVLSKRNDVFVGDIVELDGSGRVEIEVG